MSDRRAHVTEEHATGMYGGALDRLTGEMAPPGAPPQRPGPTGDTTIKLSVFLSEEENGYLEALASAAKFSGGKKLSKTKLIQAFVRAFRTSQLDVRGVKTDEELLRRVSEQLRQ